MSSLLVSRLRRHITAHARVLGHIAAVASAQNITHVMLSGSDEHCCDASAPISSGIAHQRISSSKRAFSAPPLQPAYPISIGDRAQARASRFFIGRLRSRIIRRFLLRGMVLAPLVGSVFAAKAAFNEAKRASVTWRHTDVKIPALFAAAAACDAVNCATLTGAFLKAAHHSVPLPPLVDYNVIFWWADYLALPSSLSLTLAASGATLAVAAEVLFERHTTVSLTGVAGRFQGT